MKDLVNDGFAQVVKPYIDAQDTKTRKMLAPVEPDETDASQAYEIGDQLILNGILYDVIAAIAQHGIITATGSGANIAVATNITKELGSLEKAFINQVNNNGAKNLLPNHGADIYERYGITWTKNADGTITANGTATANSYYYILGTSGTALEDFYVKGEVRLTGCPAGGSNSTYGMFLRENTMSTSHPDYSDGVTFTMDSNTTQCYVRCVIFSGVTVNNLVFKPMLRLATDPDDTYVPYAMTNKELTDVAEQVEGSYIVTSVNDDSTFSVTADGVKTVAELLAELRAVIADYMNSHGNDADGYIKPVYFMYDSGTYYLAPSSRTNRITRNSNTVFTFNNISVNSANKMQLMYLKSGSTVSNSGAYIQELDGILNDQSQVVPTSGRTFAVVIDHYRRIS